MKGINQSLLKYKLKKVSRYIGLDNKMDIHKSFHKNLLEILNLKISL